MEFKEQTGSPVVRFWQKDSGERLEMVFDSELYERRINYDTFCKRNPEVVQNYNPNNFGGLTLSVAFDRVSAMIGSFSEFNSYFMGEYENGYVDGFGKFTSEGFESVLSRAIKQNNDFRANRNNREQELAALAETYQRRKEKESPFDRFKNRATELFTEYGFNPQKCYLTITKEYNRQEGQNIEDAHKVLVVKFKWQKSKGFEIKTFLGEDQDAVLTELEDFLRNNSD